MCDVNTVMNGEVLHGTRSVQLKLAQVAEYNLKVQEARLKLSPSGKTSKDK